MLQLPEKIELPRAREFFFADFFEGPCTAWGFFETSAGKLKKTFVVCMNGEWNGDAFKLSEDFQYNDGSRDHREWILKFSEGKGFTANAEGLKSPATGRHFASGCTLSYVMALPVGGWNIRFRFTDVFHQIDQHTVLNRAKISKWGLPVGQLVIAFRK